ncbi:MAG: rhodanese-related sulfurtransferase [Micrococcaceae bacterium]
MMIEKVILYYRFTPISDPEAIKLWQKELCKRLGLKGRILISKHGINGTVGGSMDKVKEYVRETKTYPAFRGTDIKWSEGSSNDFPRLSVKAREEIVSFKAGDELKVDERGVVGTGKHLSPGKLHKLVEENKDDVVFFDGRNAYEAEIGRFKGAVIPNTETTKDFIDELDSGKYDHLKDKKVVTYCTGGVRCEILSSLMKNRGFKDVYQIDGGIVRYGETYGNKGLWEGSLYIFDRRMNQEFGKNTEVLGTCTRCQSKTSNFENCARPECHKLVLLCEDCFANEVICCSAECDKLLSERNKTNKISS